MYRVLIIDDEPFITDGLYEMLEEYKEADLDLYKAYSAQAALDLLKKGKFDIVLTDICMPEMSGLEIQKEIGKLWPKCKVIFLTGFIEFNYVHTAIRNNGFDYILKTEGDETILNAVKKAISKIEIEVRSEELVKKAQLNLSRALPLLQAKFLIDLTEGLEVLNEENRQQFRELEIPLNCEAPVFLMIARADSWADNTGLAEKMKILYNILHIVDQYLMPNVITTSMIYERSKLLLLMQPMEASASWQMEGNCTELWEKTISFIHGTMDSIQYACKELYNVSLSIIAASEEVQWDKIAGRFDALKSMLSKASGLSTEMLLIENGGSLYENAVKIEKTEDVEHEIRVKLKKIDLLADYLECNHVQDFMYTYYDIMSSIDNNNECFEDLQIEVFYSLAAMFLTCINRWKIREDIKNQIDLNRLVRYNEHESWKMITRYFYSLAEVIFQQQKRDSFNHVNGVFGFIKTYTEQHLDGDLSLTSLADLLHFNPSYLSRLFKQVTGVGISEYISGVKLKKAKELLREKPVKVIEVAAVLGLEASYFIRFFKKNTGMTPQDYRDSL